jgi:hypothetical protein
MNVNQDVSIRNGKCGRPPGIVMSLGTSEARRSVGVNPAERFENLTDTFRLASNAGAKRVASVHQEAML